MTCSQCGWKTTMYLVKRLRNSVRFGKPVFQRKTLKFRLDFVCLREDLEMVWCVYMKAFPCLTADSSVLSNPFCQNTTRCNC